MKKQLLILTALLLLAGCGREAPRPTPTAAPVYETPAPTPEPTPAETTLSGTVYEATENTLVLQSGDGALYAFSLADSAFVLPEGTMPGWEVSVRFQGGASEDSLWQTGALLEVNVTVPVVQETSGVYTLRGSVAEATMYTLTVLGEDGVLYSFPKDPQRCFAPNGILIGYAVEVDCAAAPDPAGGWQMVTVLGIRVTAPAEPVAPVVTLSAEQRQARAREILGGMTLEQRVGQVFLGRCPLQGAVEETARWQPGGYVLYGENVAGKTPTILRTEIAAMQAAAALPLLMAVDEEGGSVNRLSCYTSFRASPFPSPMALYHGGGWLNISADATEKAGLLRSGGLNVNLAPVADVCSAGSYMYPRSFGGDAALTSQYVSEVVRAYEAAGLGCVLKHFPGYGDNADTHTGSARDERSLMELQSRDLLPFAAGIDAGAHCVLVSHNVVTALDASLPASLSPAVYGYLREALHFEGVAMTDDLAMSAIQAHSAGEEPAVLALRAGCDLICAADYQREIAAVIAAVQQGRLSEARLNEAVERVLCWKLKLGIME
ncbi:MAG: glycoside hydrolase family 3 protein [Oscillospiraceae bacterium]|nr:glycoside hydrolase family 3 protein [Oscillospiraceae bacterium]